MVNNSSFKGNIDQSAIEITCLILCGSTLVLYQNSSDLSRHGLRKAAEGNKMLAADPSSPASFKVGPQTCCSVTCHICSLGLKSQEFGGKINTLIFFKPVLNNFAGQISY